jgi:hypothetical protein
MSIMGTKAIIKKIIERAGYTVHRLPSRNSEINDHAEIYEQPDIYDQDGLRSIHNHDFMSDALFCKAYQRGCHAAIDYRWHWRVHIGLWAAFAASKLEGDFVECGVNPGFLSSSIMEFLNWDSLDKTFYLLDTFEGLDLRYCSNEDIKAGAEKKNETALQSGAYVKGVESVKANFSQWNNIKIIKGSIPETLNQVDTSRVAYLHVDMNCSPPEVAAMNWFWDRLLPGAVVLFDDYAYRGYETQKHALVCSPANAPSIL